ncbi:MAG: hypothetical protein ACK2U9_21170 [Anaerolineae bacterium]
MSQRPAGYLGRRRNSYCKDCLTKKSNDDLVKYKNPAGAVTYLCPPCRSTRLRQDNLGRLNNSNPEGGEL